ncbi:gamma-glutamyl-gamma-aminobutyrate hydrolase family protein [Aestuariivirga litoralis]|uniref:gamma-glutamyl-gamma-aminobutyrate hydrolase n=1 Tax=Aestuariivirga litoralis TaxID=2650924 RepID=A0A2W2BF52_9HYPH|nr:gamma-glutamyl-gamma-aminobutyrate hydrolase family protein [Aestuariivirga litoralis]PZF78838.1 gamma-glutamyl-gamma-aminobutyrate hydrolase family protein [Aestuariivirga litoralis]
MSYLPLVGLPADTYESHGFQYHSIGDKYVRAVAEVALCSPVMIPSMIDALQLDDLLEHFDGIVMTGAVSNVHPPHYGEQPTVAHEPYDHGRDATTLKLIEKVLKKGLPLFCICRGFQELNVVLGGTLETELQQVEGRLDHRAPDHDDVDVRYAPSHAINIRPGGLLEQILGKRETMVNSIHRQGIKRLAKGLQVEATAPDGIIEAVSVRDAKSFAMGTQWHPEFRALNNPDSVKLFTAFGNAVRGYAAARGKTLRTVA